jgi:hypothetical protein
VRSGVSSGEINLFGAGLVEAEVGLVLAHDLPPKPDLSKYTPEEAWEAVDSVVAAIEICGRRSSRSCSAVPQLALFSDALDSASGGVDQSVAEILLPAPMADPYRLSHGRRIPSTRGDSRCAKDTSS